MTAMDERLQQTQDRLKAQFTAMETALSSSQNQQQWLAGQIAGLARQGQLVATAVAVAGIESTEQRSIVIVHAARHHAGTVAERAFHPELRRNGFPDKRHGTEKLEGIH